MGIGTIQSFINLHFTNLNTTPEQWNCGPSLVTNINISPKGLIRKLQEKCLCISCHVKVINYKASRNCIVKSPSSTCIFRTSKATTTWNTELMMNLKSQCNKKIIKSYQNFKIIQWEAKGMDSTIVLPIWVVQKVGSLMIYIHKA